MASGRLPQYRVVDPVRDGHHPHEGTFVAHRAPLPDPSPQEMQKQQTLLGAATPMPRQPSDKLERDYCHEGSTGAATTTAQAAPRRTGGVCGD